MPTFEGTLKIDEQGNPKITERAFFLNWCNDHKGKKCEIIVKPLGRKSDPLRRYYFGVVVEAFRYALRNQCGYNFTKDETHDFIKQFSPSMHEELHVNGVVHTRFKSIASKHFTNTDFLTYIEELKQFAAEELDVFIPDPGDLGDIDPKIDG